MKELLLECASSGRSFFYTKKLLATEALSIQKYILFYKKPLLVEEASLVDGAKLLFPLSTESFSF